MEENNKIVTIVEIDSQQAQMELVKLNATVSNTTKTLEERIDAKNKAIEIQNKLSEKTIKLLNDNVKSLENVAGKEKDYEKAISKLASEQLKSVKVQEQSVVQLDKLNLANDKAVAKSQAQEGSVKSLRIQLREATVEQGKMAQKFGETSPEAIKAAKAVAELKDQIQFNADLVASFNPDQKFKALGAATELAATGTSAVVSGMALFGDQSEETEKALLKVQAAMAFSQAISSLSNIGDQYKILKSTIVGAYLSITTAKTAETVATEANLAVENQSIAAKAKGVVVTGASAVATGVATAAQWLWNVAVMSNPIIAFIVALAAATAGIYFLAKALIANSDANDKAAKDTEKLAKALDKESLSLYKAGKSIRDKNEHTLAMAKANGASSESIRKLEKKLLDEQIATDKASATTASNTFIQERNSLAKLKAAGASDEVIKAREKEVQAAYDTFQRENKQLDASYKQRAKLVKDQEVQIATEKTEARKKSIEASKKAEKDSEEATKKKAKDDADAKAKAEKEAKDALELKKREAKAQIELAELDISKKKTADPKADTLKAEQEVLNKKKEYELMTADLLGSEKQAIAEKYSLLDVELVRKTEQDKANAIYEVGLTKLEQDQALRDIDFENHSRTILEKNDYEVAKLQEKTAFELTNLKLTEAEKLKIKQDSENQIALMNAKAVAANKSSVDKQASDGIDALAESFGVAKEVAVAKMIMAAPEAIGNSFKNASAAYIPPISFVMGALGAATTVVPIIKGLSDIKKTRFSGKKKGGTSGGASAGSISSTASSGVSKISVGDLAANNAAQLGVDPSLKGGATSQAANNVLGSSGRSVVFSEGKYSDFKNQVQFKEQKTSI